MSKKKPQNNNNKLWMLSFISPWRRFRCSQEWRRQDFSPVRTQDRPSRSPDETLPLIITHPPCGWLRSLLLQNRKRSTVAYTTHKGRSLPEPRPLSSAGPLLSLPVPTCRQQWPLRLLLMTDRLSFTPDLQLRPWPSALTSRDTCNDAGIHLMTPMAGQRSWMTGQESMSPSRGDPSAAPAGAAD